MKIFDREIMFTSSEQQMGTVYIFMLEQLWYEKTLITILD